MLIAGKRLQSKDSFDVINPYTNQRVDSVPIATLEQIDEALDLSHRTVPTLTAIQRARVLEDVSNELLEKKKELAELITAESGLCLKDTFHEIERAAACAHLSSLMAERVENDVTGDYALDSPQGRPELEVVTEPLDLVVGITPFNHPVNQVAHKVFPAIAAGACMVLKPSEKTSLSALRLGEILLEKGLEQNVLNIVTGRPAERIVDPMLSSPLIEMVTFTGSLTVGLLLKEKLVAAGHALRKYVPELGGCSTDDCPLDLPEKEAPAYSPTTPPMGGSPMSPCTRCAFLPYTLPMFPIVCRPRRSSLRQKTLPVDMTIFADAPR